MREGEEVREGADGEGVGVKKDYFCVLRKTEYVNFCEDCCQVRTAYTDGFS